MNESNSSDTSPILATDPDGDHKIAKTSKSRPTDDEVAASWLSNHPNTAYGLGEYRRYSEGVWNVLHKDKADFEILQELKLMKSKGITPGAHFILGLPGSDVKSAVRTIGFAISLNPGYASFNAYTPRQGSELFESRNSGAKKSFVWRMVLRAAYIRFYLRPHRILSFFKRDRVAFGNQSLMSIIRYLLFLPDMNPNDDAVVSKMANLTNQTDFLL